MSFISIILNFIYSKSAIAFHCILIHCVIFKYKKPDTVYYIFYMYYIMAIRLSSFVHSFNICFLPKWTFNSLFIFLGQYVSNFINIYILYGHIDINMITFKKLSSTRSSCCTQVHVHCFDSKG